MIHDADFIPKNETCLNEVLTHETVNKACTEIEEGALLCVMTSDKQESG